MTLLLFIASLGIVHYIISRQPGTRRRESDAKPTVPPPEAAGLFALGEALEHHGRGAIPRAPAAPKAAEQALDPAAVKDLTR
jgi:hypothetical protein